MNSNNILINPEGDSLFHRVASILEQARGNVARSINSNMVLAYWMIGREIVLELQDAEAHAFYEQEIVDCGWNKAQLERQIQSSSAQ